MILKYLSISILILIVITAADPYFGYDFSWEPVPKGIEDDVKELPWMSSKSFKPYLMDEDNRISENFKVTDYFYPNVNFWFLIYTQFESSAVVIHDKSNLTLIYKVLDFSSLHKKNLHQNVIYEVQQKVSAETIKALSAELDELAKDPFSLSPSAKKIYKLLKNANIDPPINKSDRSLFFTHLKHNLRSQTGQKNYIRDGIMRSLPYQKFLDRFFKERQLPTELLAIPFLESSFNPIAHSKAKALGIWQFMPHIASYFVPPQTNQTDYRSNIGVASIAASFLLAENFQVVKSWDLAVTAYNSGTKHLLKTKRELGVPGVNLQMVIENSDSEHFGFASKNFYSEFLALAHTLAYREELFEKLHEHDRSDVDLDLKFYMTKCPLKLPKGLADNILDDIRFHNHHISDYNQVLPRGFILTTKADLPKQKFYQIPNKYLLKKRPKDLIALLKRQSCSTR
jgi:membrane-bound lytic murein transglycosylase D